MTYRTILVCLTTVHSAERLLKVAVDLAQRSNSHLIGLHTLEAAQVYPGVVATLPSDSAQSFNEEQQKIGAEIKDIFETMTANQGFVSEWRLVKAGSTRASDRMVEHAHCADLVIMGQADAEHDRIDQYDAQRQVVRKSGRPVLVIPHSGTFETIGKKALIGWSATREASRAIHDAIPLFHDDGEAIILWVSHSDKNAAYFETTAHQVAACVNRHGVDATVTHWQNSEIAIGAALLNEAFDRGADLIVTGAFGHSKFYDFVIGATTSHLLENMTVPVLFSH